MRPRRLASGATLVLLTGVLAAAASPATGDQVRTTTSLGGYSVSTNAAPFKVLVDDPAVPIPRPADSAIVEADPAYSEADLGTGPTSRGIGAVLWPGGLLGEGLTQVAPGAPAWPLKAEARYPDKPYVATEQDKGTFMRGQALGLDVLGAAQMAPSPVPGSLDVGGASSVSTATVKNGVAIGTSESHVTDVSLLGGIIKVGSVSTTLTVRSDGTHPASTGTTVVNGLTIAGKGYVVDDQGARPVGTPVTQGSGPLPVGLLDPATALGITIGGLSQDHSEDADSATRDAKGLRITVDTKVLRGVLDQTTPSPLTDALYALFSEVPTINVPQVGNEDVRGYLFYLMAATPKITFILGAGQGNAAATLPLSFHFPPITFPGGFGGPPVGVTTGGGPVTAPITSSGGPTVVPPTGPGPEIGPSTNPVPVAASLPTDPFHGIPAGLVLLVAAVSATAAWGLLRLRGTALGAAGAAACTDGSSPTLPDLRGA